MATGAVIGVENSDGTVTSINCWNDGHPFGVGRKLAQHYDTPFKAKELMMLGNLSSLGAYISPIKEKRPPKPDPNVPGWLAPWDLTKKHSYDNRHPNVTVAYHRDRGDSFEQKKWKDVESYWKDAEEDYIYLFTGGKWMVKNDDGEIVSVKDELGDDFLIPTV